MSSIKVNHFGITVQSIQDATNFWTEVFGFTAHPVAHYGGSMLEQVTGVRHAKGSSAFLTHGDVTVELLEYQEPQDGRRLDVRPNDIGGTHLALNVDNLAGVVRSAEPYGWRPAGEPQTVSVGPFAGTRVVYLSNAAGNTLELMQLPDESR